MQINCYDMEEIIKDFFQNSIDIQKALINSVIDCNKTNQPL